MIPQNEQMAAVWDKPDLQAWYTGLSVSFIRIAKQAIYYQLNVDSFWLIETLLCP